MACPSRRQGFLALAISFAVCQGARLAADDGQTRRGALKAETAVSKVSASDCPKQWAVDANGGCVDQATRRPAPQHCCGAYADCQLHMADLQRAYGKRLALYSTECALRHGDVVKEADGRVTVRSTKRICSAKCVNLPELDFPAPPLMELESVCPRAELKQMEATARLLEALDSAWSACEGELLEEEGSESGRPFDPFEWQANLTVTPKPLLPTCPDPSMVAHDCGRLGTTQADCEARGCCWDPPAPGRSRNGRPWCYKKAGSVKCSRQCPKQHFKPEHREECAPFLLLDQFVDPRDSVRGEACLSVGCCWQPLQHGSKEPWCFHTPCV